MKDLIQQLFPDGEFITFDDIQKGDSIARGGATVYGEELLYGVAILRAWKLEEYTDQKTWVTDDRGFSSSVGVQNDEEYEHTMWYYRINNSVVSLPVDQPTNTTWTTSVTAVATANGDFTDITLEDLHSGITIMVADLNEGDVADDHFDGDIFIGKIDEQNDTGWPLRATDDFVTDFLPVLNAEYTSEGMEPTIWKLA